LDVDSCGLSWQQISQYQSDNFFLFGLVPFGIDSGMTRCKSIIIFLLSLFFGFDTSFDNPVVNLGYQLADDCVVFERELKSTLDWPVVADV